VKLSMVSPEFGPRNSGIREFGNCPGIARELPGVPGIGELGIGSPELELETGILAEFWNFGIFAKAATQLFSVIESTSFINKENTFTASTVSGSIFSGYKSRA